MSNADSSSPPAAERATEWDFYPCRVDDAPASILLDLGLREEAPLPGLDHLYWITIEMKDGAEHGMGSAAEAETLYPLEDAIQQRMEGMPFVQVGRLRNLGNWQLSFFGPAGREALLEDCASAVLRGQRDYETGSQRDEAWGYYFEFLLPDRERMQWIMNRRVTDQLRQQGDNPDIPRTIDHFLYFQSESDRADFVRWANEHGFSAKAEPPESDDSALPVHVAQHAPAQLSVIHEAVMELLEAAEERNGEYDGWGCPVEKAEA